MVVRPWFEGMKKDLGLVLNRWTTLGIGELENSLSREGGDRLREVFSSGLRILKEWRMVGLTKIYTRSSV